MTHSLRYNDILRRRLPTANAYSEARSMIVFAEALHQQGELGDITNCHQLMPFLLVAEFLGLPVDDAINEMRDINRAAGLDENEGIYRRS